MTNPTPPTNVPILALSVAQAAASIGLSENVFRSQVLPTLRSIKVGKARIIPVAELEKWLYLHARFEDEDG